MPIPDLPDARGGAYQPDARGGAYQPDARGGAYQLDARGGAYQPDDLLLLTTIRSGRLAQDGVVGVRRGDVCLSPS